MCRRLIFLISFVLVAGLVSSVSAAEDIYWDDGDPCDHLWSSPLNWNPDGVPRVINAATEDGDCAYIEADGFGLENSPIIDDSVIKEDPNTGSETMTVCVGTWSGGNAYLTMTGGYVSTVWEVILGAFSQDANGTLNMSGGLIELAGTELFIACCGTGNLNMTGGVIDTNGGPLAMPGTVDWSIKGNGQGTGHINLDGGSIICASIFMQEPSTIDVNGGTLTILGDARSIIAQYADQGWITGRGSTDPRNVAVVYDDVNDLTIVTYDPTPDLTLAWRPSPGIGTTVADWKPTLSWQPGCYAKTHTVYFGSSLSDVNASATAVSVNQPGTTYAVPNYLEFGQTYYWRIDEVNDPCVWPGPVWNFTVADYVSVDDFDAYADQAALRAVWRDGSMKTGGNGTGSTVDVNTSIIRSGKSVKFEYNNNVGGKDKFSEIEADAYDLVIGTDWTPSSAKALALQFYGDPGNDATEQMYVALGDGNGNVAVKNYHLDMNDIRIAEWQQWNIKLQDFNDINNVDLTNVTKVYIGFGDRFNPLKGGSGIVYFDDIEIHPTWCVGEFAPAADVTGDCLVYYADVNALASDWLVSEYFIVATPPSSPVGWWKLDEGAGTTAVDSAGSNPGTLGGPAFLPRWYNDPSRGWCLDFDEVGYVSIPSAAFTNVNDEITVTLWQYGDTEMTMAAPHVMFHATDACAPDPFDLTIKGEFFGLSDEGCEVWWDAGFGGAGGEDSFNGSANPEDYQGQWNHYAFTKNANTSEMKIYLNGVLFASKDDANSPVTGTDIAVFKIGSYYDGVSRRYDGYMSDFRLYNYALSYGEVRYVAGQMDDLYIPLPNPDVDLHEDGKVNFKDYAVLANGWLVETLWP